MSTITHFLNLALRSPSRSIIIGLLFLFLILATWVGFRFYHFYLPDAPQNQAFWKWATGDEAARESLIINPQEKCPDAPFILPASGFIGLLYADPRGPYSRQNPHQGIDIFSDAPPGSTPVYAAYDGYITREENWVSTLIMRVPVDPLQKDRQIWLYYTHMADRRGRSFIADPFPPGTSEFFVQQGTLLGYTGDYNGDSPRDIWVHLHFSIIRDDGSGNYTNELEFTNSVDPTPYLGMIVNYHCQTAETACTVNPVCEN